MTYPVRIDRRVFVAMEDGTRIALTLYLPDAAGDGPFPAVLESLPYRKDDDCTARDFSTYAYLASHGIAGVRIDIRGTGASNGIIADEYTGQEQADNLEVMRWVAAQDWCTGNLGMWGISWGGFSSLQTAMLRPPELKAIAAMHATHDRFACDVHYTGGSLHAAEQVDWPASMVASNALPPDPDIVGEAWFEEWIHRLENTPQWPFEWFRHQQRDDYWLHGSPCADYGAIVVPTLLIGGWLDGYVDGMLALAENLECPVRTVIGPWGHYRPATGVPGPTLDHFDLLARWFGHHLRGDDNGVMDMPALAVFVRTAPPYDGETVDGYWRAEQSWPSVDRQVLEAPLETLGGSESVWAGPQWIGAHAPVWDRAGVGSGDSAADDAESLVFETEPLPEEIEILGAPELALTVTSDKGMGMVAVRLLIVDPEGQSHLISRGSRNLSFPEDLGRPVPVVAGELIDLVVPLMAVSAVIPAGWRIRLAVAGADFPVVWPPPEPFTLTVDPYRSALRLPTVPSGPARAVLDIPPSPSPIHPPVEKDEEGSDVRVIRRGGTTAFRHSKHGSEHQPTRNHLTYRFEQTWTVSVEDTDPSSTRVESDVAVSLQRPGWAVATSARLAISGGSELVIEVDLAAEHDGMEVFRRSWREPIPRRWV